jgi:hypothetical protein
MKIERVYRPYLTATEAAINLCVHVLYAPNTQQLSHWVYYYTHTYNTERINKNSLNLMVRHAARALCTVDMKTINSM